MKLTRKIIGLSILLFILWIFNSYRNGDFESVPQNPTPKPSKETMAHMDARFQALPETEFSDKQQKLEIDLEQYEKTVNGINDTIRDRIQVQNHVLDDSQVQLRPTYDQPRRT
jgi:hypothetical protein